MDSFLSDRIKRYFLLVDTKTENLEFSQRLKRVVDENVKLQQVAQENIHLRLLLDFQQKTASTGSVANVIAYRSGETHQIIVDRGSIDGVQPAAAVVDGIGLVGKVITVSNKSSVVQLLTDRFSGIDSVIREKSVRGMVTGAGTRALNFDFVARDQEVYVGDRVLTSGLGGIYPPGLLVGVVSNIASSDTDILFQSIQIHPAINLEALVTVMILDPLPEENLSQEPVVKDSSSQDLGVEK